MKKKIILSAAFLLSMLFLAGCGKDSADKYVGEEITSMKKERRIASPPFWRMESPKAIRSMYSNSRKN